MWLSIVAVLAKSTKNITSPRRLSCYYVLHLSLVPVDNKGHFENFWCLSDIHKRLGGKLHDGI